MNKSRTLFAAFLLSILALQALGCSSSSMMSNRVLESMVVSPATADAQNFPNGQVQFTATGTFSKPPSPDLVTFQPPYSGDWGTLGMGSATIATINSTGLAQCVPGAAGTVTIVATASANSANGPAMSVGVAGTAQLTCP